MNQLVIEKQGGSYYLRKSIEGKQREISLQTADKKTADSRARRLLATATAQGLEAAMTELRGGIAPVTRGLPNFENVARLYRSYCAQSENPIRANTREENLRVLKSIMDAVGVQTVGSLTWEKLNKYKREFLAAGNDSPNTRRTLTSRSRKAASIFKKKALAYYQAQGEKITKNPFAGVELPSPKIEPYTPLTDEVRTKVIKESRNLPPLLRMAFLLGLNSGMRRNEADKALTSWITKDGKGSWVSIEEQGIFIPKGRGKRIVPLPPDVHEKLMELREEAIEKAVESSRNKEEAAAKLRKSPYLLPVRAEHKIKLGKSVSYRLGRRWVTLIEWLEQHGVTDGFHQLRKEFGSLVAKEYGLHAAFTYLGHSKFEVTVNHYASMIDKPALNLAGMV